MIDWIFDFFDRLGCRLFSGHAWSMEISNAHVIMLFLGTLEKLDLVDKRGRRADYWHLNDDRCMVCYKIRKHK